jgi:hypothetical protein
MPKKLNQLKSSLSRSVSGSIFLAWATYYDLKGNPHPESSSWVANDFNWTGTFYSIGVFIPTPWGINLDGSYFSSNFSQMRYVLNKRIKPKDEHVWWGVSVGISGGYPRPCQLNCLASLSLRSTARWALRAPSIRWCVTTATISTPPMAMLTLVAGKAYPAIRARWGST